MKVNINLEFDSEIKKDTAVLAAIAGILAGAVNVDLSDVTVGDQKAVAVGITEPEPEAKPAPAKRKGRTKTEEQKAAEAAQQEAEQKAAVEAMTKAAVEELKPEPEVKEEPKPEPKPEVKAEPAPTPVVVDYAKDVRPLVIRFVQATSHEHVLNWLQTNFAVQSAMKIPADQLGKARDMLAAELENFKE